MSSRASQHLRMQLALDLVACVSDTLLNRTVVDRGLTGGAVPSEHGSANVASYAGRSHELTGTLTRWPMLRVGRRLIFPGYAEVA
jgi:hypothetical protein